jgi:anti-sigma factor RsiW
MSDTRRRLASKGALRLTAWSSAAAAFLASWGVLGTLPKPTASVVVPRTEAPRIVVIRKVLRRVIVPAEAPAASAPPAVTFSPGSSGSSNPPPPAPTSTGGS